MPKIPDRSVDDTDKTYLDTHNIYPRSGTDPAPAPAAENLSKYGMCDMDLEKYIVMYEMEPGQESLIMKRIALLATKGLSKEQKNNIVQTVCKDLDYEDCNIPMTTQILQLFKEKSFGRDDDAETALAAMKGLSI